VRKPTGPISVVRVEGDNQNGTLGRASFADLPLDADERDRLLLLRAATSQNAGAYVAVLAVLVELTRSEGHARRGAIDPRHALDADTALGAGLRRCVCAQRVE
jgi:hypothetical protein